MALPKLSSAQQMAEMLLRELVHYFGGVHGDFSQIVHYGVVEGILVAFQYILWTPPI